MISKRQEIFFYHRLSTCKLFSSTDCTDNFFKIPQILHNRGSLCRQLFSDAPLGQTIYFSNFSHADSFFPITIPPGENNGSSLKEIIQSTTHWDSQGNKKNAISVSIAFSFDVLIRNENIIPMDAKQKIILHVERVTSNQSWVINTIEEIMSRSNLYKRMFNF